MWTAIYQISYVLIFHIELFNEIRVTVESISDRVSEKFHIVTTRGFSRENVSNFDYYPQFCIIWKIKYLHGLLHQKPPNLLEFLSSFFPIFKVRDVFLKTPLFEKKLNMIFIWLESFLCPLLKCIFSKFNEVSWHR